LISKLQRIGVSTRKVKWIGRDGAPDRLILTQGGIWAELKALGQKPRPSQVREHNEMREAGFRVLVIDSIEQIDNLVKECEKNLNHENTKI